MSSVSSQEPGQPITDYEHLELLGDLPQVLSSSVTFRLITSRHSWVSAPTRPSSRRHRDPVVGAYGRRDAERTARHQSQSGLVSRNGSSDERSHRGQIDYMVEVSLTALAQPGENRAPAGCLSVRGFPLCLTPPSTSSASTARLPGLAGSLRPRERRTDRGALNASIRKATQDATLRARCPARTGMPQDATNTPTGFRDYSRKSIAGCR